MKQVSFYDLETGVIHPKLLACSDERHIAINIPPGHGHIEGHFDSESYRVDTASGRVVDYQPPAPSADHEWDVLTRRWILNAAEQARQLKRANALAQIEALELKGQRAQRELALGYDGAKQRVQAIDDEIASLRGDIT